MIKAILVFNNQGKPRISKFYVHFVSNDLMHFFSSDNLYLSCFRVRRTSRQSSRKCITLCLDGMTQYATL